MLGSFDYCLRVIGILLFGNFSLGSIYLFFIVFNIRGVGGVLRVDMRNGCRGVYK